MLGSVGLVIAKWWKSSNSSNILAIVILVALVFGVGYVQNLRVKVAACESSAEAQKHVKKLGERLKKSELEKLDGRIEEIEGADHYCLDMRSADLLRGDND